MIYPTNTTQKEQPLVLVIDDDQIIRLLACESLRQAGFAVAEADNGAQGLLVFDQLQPQIVLMDVNMPEMDGFQACTELRQRPGGDRTPILMVTGLDDIESITKAYEVGATDFITKPFNWMLLQHRVRYMLRASQAAEDLRKSESRLARAQRIAHLGNWEWDLRTNHFQGSAELHRLFGVGSDYFPETCEAFWRMVHPDDREIVKCSITEALQGRKMASTDHRIILPDGSIRIVHQQAEVISDETGVSRWMMGTVQDITERKQAEEQIRFLAYYDSLTSLPNRLLLKEHLNYTLKQAQRHDHMVAVLFLDLDRFKRINDTLSHSVGDSLLQGVAERLVQCVRKSDIIARHASDEVTNLAHFGGDEFTLLLPKIIHVEDAARVARRLLRTLSDPFMLDTHEVVITTSIGISVYPADGQDVDSLLKNADTAMYHAKDMGGNCYQFYSQSMNAKAFERLTLEHNLRKALENEEFLLYYQPQLDLHTDKIVGVEALIRWQHPEMGIISPAEFIPLAEETGLILPLGTWVLRTACAQSKVWQKVGLGSLRVGVNLSALQFRQQDLLETISQVLRDTGVDPQYLELELTESTIMRQAKETITTLQALKAMGIRIAIDDFGTGYSSLGYLKRFPIDTLKIDRSFVKDIPTNADDTAITTAIIAMAHTLKLSVVAEGVETTDQLAFLQTQHCDEIQGYLLSKPVPAKMIPQLLEQPKTQQ
jgi:diguanylate cyclase (GGDEF)-like protein/PAS domain S-box-containing protein